MILFLDDDSVVNIPTNGTWSLDVIEAPTREENMTRALLEGRELVKSGLEEHQVIFTASSHRGGAREIIYFGSLANCRKVLNKLAENIAIGMPQIRMSDLVSLAGVER